MLLKLLNLFFNYERKEIAEFRKAVKQFKANLPATLAVQRDKIDTAYNNNCEFRRAAVKFPATTKETINRPLTNADFWKC